MRQKHRAQRAAPIRIDVSLDTESGENRAELIGREDPRYHSSRTHSQVAAPQIGVMPRHRERQVRDGEFST
ncbi:hypothetical protein [Sorangium cellulosum]|uniref:hypothetical protein n=1 Tax=Sorangium cellulosum TaxID=56 RepID=UPI000AE144C4|nr:hypothetical protein [Sorangium cellulosum]